MIRKILNIREWVTRSKVLIFMPEKDKYKTGTPELIFFRPDLGLLGNLYFMNLGIEARPVWSVPASLSSADGYGVKANCSQGVPVQIQWPKICHRLNLSIFCLSHIRSLLPCALSFYTSKIFCARPKIESQGIWLYNPLLK